MTPVSSWIPFEWPEAWHDAVLLDLLNETPFNCILFPPRTPPSLIVRAGERFQCPERIEWTKAGEMDWARQQELVAIGDAVWPSLGRTQALDSIEAGPTGAPWLDANGWLIRMAKSLAPSSEIWIRSASSEKPADQDDSIRMLAHSEAMAHGARRPFALPPDLAMQLAAGAQQAQASWREATALARWWEQRRQWGKWQPYARLLAISDFSGANADTATEFLNLAARRNLACRIAGPDRAAQGALEGMAAAIYLDRQAMPQTLLKAIQSFVEAGGLVVTLNGPAKALTRLEPLREQHPRFALFRCGQGRVAVSRQDWEDPYILAQDTHLLVSRRHDAIRLFNAGSILAYHTAPAGGGRWLVHLLNYARHSAAHEVSLQTWARVSSARLHQFGQEPVALGLHRESGGLEVHLPSFTIHCAVELELSSYA